MICMTCSASIPPAWVACIQSNSCPGCAGPIMDEAAKELLGQIKDAMIKMPNDPEGLAGWLMSTFDLFPKGTIEATVMHRKPSSTHQQSGQPTLAWANSPSHNFMKRAGADKVLNDPKLVSIANAIKTANSAEGDMYGDQLSEEPNLSVEEQESIMQEQMQLAAAKAKGQGKRLTMKDALANSVIFNTGENGPPLSNTETALMQHIVGGSTVDEDGLDNDVDSLPPALQQDRLKRLATQRDLVHGGSSGFIKRSS